MKISYCKLLSSQQRIGDYDDVDYILKRIGVSCYYDDVDYILKRIGVSFYP